MKGYSKPLVIDNEMFESVYADSSGDAGGWEFIITWEGHNSGHHSEIKIRVINRTGKAWRNYEVALTFTGAGSITTWNPDGDGVSGASSYSESGNTIYIRYSADPINNNDDHTFQMKAKFDTPQYEEYFDGAEKRGIAPCSYYKSDDPEHCHVPAGGDFTASMVSYN